MSERQIHIAEPDDYAATAAQEDGEFYHLLVETSPEGVAVCAGHRIVFANTALVKLCGAHDPGEIIGHSVFDFVHPDSRAELEEWVRFPGRTTIDHHARGEEKWLRLDGSVIDVDAAFAPVAWHGETALQIVLRERDVHEQAGAALYEAEERLRLMVENARDYAIFMLDPQGRISCWNPGAEGIFGYDEDEVTGENVSLLFTPEDRAAGESDKEIKSAVETGRAEDERWHLRKDGSRFYASGVLNAIRDKSGNLLGFTKIARDITSRKEFEEGLQENEVRLRQLADAMPQIVWTTGADGRMDYHNKRWYEYTGLRPDQTPSDPTERWKAILHPEDVARTTDAWNESIRTGKPFQIEYRYRDRKTGGYHWHLGRALPVRDVEGRIIRWFGTCTDIDDQKRAEQALAKAQRQLRKYADDLEKRVAERTIRLEELNRSLESFNYSIAHDLRAPLRAIRAYAGFLLRGSGQALDVAGLDYARQINKAAEHMDQLIQDLLAYGRLTRGEISFMWVSLDEIFADLLVLLRDDIQTKKAAIELRQPLPRVWANSVVLKQILNNLLRNALKFVEADMAPRVQIWTEDRGSAIRIWIRDYGIGIEREEQERIFELFQRLHTMKTYPGTGIGLAIVQKGMERMGGRVGVESEPGKGASFWIELPKPPEPA